MRSAFVARTAAIVALVAISLVGWVVYRTGLRAEDTSRWVLHTQEVLTEIEVVRAEAANAVHSAAVTAGIERLGTLTADNSQQQASVGQLRDQASRAQADLLTSTLRSMRVEENRLLGDRVRADRTAVRRLQTLLATILVAASGLLGLVIWLFARTARTEDSHTAALRQSAADFEDEVAARSGDLHDTTERLRSIIDSAVDGILVIDAKGRIEAFNPGAERLFGYRAAEVIGQNVSMLMPSPYHEEHDGYLARYMTTGEAKIIGIGREVMGRRSDGSTFPLHLSVGEMLVDGERKFTGILHDLSARVRMEEQLREQASLARIGEMAAVIAHEVKNPLAGIRGAVQVIGNRLPKDSRDAGMMREIVARVDSLNELMRDLLLFARPPQPRPAPVELDALVTSTADLLTADPELKDVSVTIDGRVPPVDADAALLKIVFVNLLVNGAHAMQGRGRIRVSLGMHDNMSSVAFADEGPGIPADVREKIFTPFFTTKARGSGLGLPTAKRLIEAHHGTIDITCPPGGGTTVTIQLPARVAAAV